MLLSAITLRRKSSNLRLLGEETAQASENLFTLMMAKSCRAGINSALTIEAATLADTHSIVSIFIANKDDPGLFQESEAEVRRNLRDFVVARDANGAVVACSGLHRDSDELAEVYGVAVLPPLQCQGIGAMLMQKSKERALTGQLTCLWLATVKPEYFRRYSFYPISRWSLPTSVLSGKLRQVFQQPVQRWAPVLFGRHTFMKCNLLLKSF